MKIEITDNACNKIQQLINVETNRNNPALRIGVDGGGCSGFQYKYEIIASTDITSNDLIFSKNNISVVIDSLSMQFLSDATLDFIEELGNSYFAITNPNATAKCGCGNSFGI